MKQFLLLGGLALLLACNPPTPPVENKAPIASFTSATTVEAGTALGFSSTSSDPDGDALTLSWDFGNGVRGGGASIANVYTKVGSFTVRLTAADGKGGVSSSEKTIAVTANSLVVGTALSVVGTISDALGAPLSGVTVELNGTTLGSSDASGKVTVSVPTGVPINLVLNKTGYAEGFAALEFPIGSNANNGDFKATLMARGAAQPIDAGVGGAITGTDNARLELAANALVKPDGTPVTGSVNVSLSPVDINDPLEKNAFPGSFEGIQSNGSSTGIVSLGTTEFVLEQGGQRLNLKAGSSAKVRLPMYANTNLDGSPINLGDSIPIWSLNEQTGDWVQEGAGIVVDAGNGTRVLEAVVTHFSWWNVDQQFTPSNPKPKCINDVPGQYDSIFEQAVFCKFLAELDKPIPAQGSNLRPQNSLPRLPAFAATINLPIAGNLNLPVPAGVNVRYTGCIASGAFCGSVVKNFAANSSETFEIRLKRTDTEEIMLPFDAVRNINALRRFTFDSSTNPNGVSITLERSVGSSFTGTAFLLDPQGNEIGSKGIGSTSQTFEQQLFASGKHILEIRPSAGSSGGLRIRVERKNFVPISNWTTLTQSTIGIEDNLNLVLNPAGQGAAFWVQKDNSALPLYSLSSSTFEANSNTWDAAQLLETQSNHRPHVALGVAGNADKILIWSQPTVLRWSRRAAGESTWGAAATLETISANRITTHLQIKMDSSGNAVALWLEYGGSFSGNIIRLARYAIATGLWTVETIGTGSFPDTPVLALDAAGNIAVLYFDFTPSIGYYIKRNVVGVWSTATKLFTPSAAPNGFTSAHLELNASGNGMAVWDDAGTLRTRAYDFATDTWKPEQNFIGTNAKIGLHTNGNASLVYRQFANPAALFARTYAVGTDAWSATQTLSDSSQGGVIGLDNNAAFNSSGDAVALFIKEQQTFLTSRVSSASSWTTPVPEGAFDTRRVALDDMGKAVMLRLGFNSGLGKYEIQAKRINVR
jgi:hypothetical protein